MNQNAMTTLLPTGLGEINNYCDGIIYILGAFQLYEKKTSFLGRIQKVFSGEWNSAFLNF